MQELNSHSQKPRTSMHDTKTCSFDGHDGCGKGTTISLLAELIDAEIYETPAAIKEYRRGLVDLEASPSRTSALVKSYELEQKVIEEHRQACSKGILLLDRSFASCAAERYARRDVLVAYWPEEVHHPDLPIVLQIEEDLRRSRIWARFESGGPELNDRELLLEQDDEYRGRLEQSWMDLELTPLPVRTRSPAVVALRAQQLIIAHL